MLVALLGVLGVGAGFAIANSGPPKPVITSVPANPTASTSASFSFGDPQKGVSFMCALDGTAYTACSSPVSYSGLGQGTHAFSVQAKSASGTSSPASYSWRIDRTPPSIALGFPAAGGDYNAAAWNEGCVHRGICGGASDPSGVAAVLVSVRQNATGRYWNGNTFVPSAELYLNVFLNDPGDTSVNWLFSLPLPPDGSYTIHERATDELGNSTPTSSPDSAMFTIDTASPPPPTITAHPANPTNQTTGSLSFTDPEPGVSFRCRIDLSSYTACSSPKTYSGLAQGTHTFNVEAGDAAGNISASTSYSWVVDTTPPPVPVITSKPTNPTTSTTATLTFTDPEAGVSFQCQLDGGSFTGCTSPASYSSLSVAAHSFSVRAVDPAGNISASASYSWMIQQTTGVPFTISGNTPSPLYPGAGV